eukprot:CAMPEP_0178449824 /NCGR_PEP_ID=MMETSP0689_2-20121128/42778_1 /TAXON_ID=160604 /ORGANISM="Amphidinium massartii, Strain CS-259" /LENGTH=88 /DNA_ID=CAMNT_0020075211 /DNA_START=96 /DNA_END=362 /DNA_ORIENTATION=+
MMPLSALLASLVTRIGLRICTELACPPQELHCNAPIAKAQLCSPFQSCPSLKVISRSDAICSLKTAKLGLSCDNSAEISVGPPGIAKC